MSISGTQTPNQLGFEGGWEWQSAPTNQITVFRNNDNESGLKYSCDDFIPNTIVCLDNYSNTSYFRGPYSNRYMAAILTLARFSNDIHYFQISFEFFLGNTIANTMHTRSRYDNNWTQWKRVHDNALEPDVPVPTGTTLSNMCSKKNMYNGLYYYKKIS
jgi:hypothetical protein